MYMIAAEDYAYVMSYIFSDVEDVREHAGATISSLCDGPGRPCLLRRLEANCEHLRKVSSLIEAFLLLRKSEASIETFLAIEKPRIEAKYYFTKH